MRLAQAEPDDAVAECVVTFAVIVDERIHHQGAFQHPLADRLTRQQAGFAIVEADTLAVVIGVDVFDAEAAHRRQGSGVHERGGCGRRACSSWTWVNQVWVMASEAAVS